MTILVKTVHGDYGSIYQAAVAIRKEVFIQEQGVAPELELDHESQATYFVIYVDDQAAATARVMVEKDGAWHLQRVATRKAYRGRGLASKLIMKIEALAMQKQVPYLTLGAQDHAQTFYQQLGFKVVGTGFLDAGIAHHQMQKKLISKTH
ncbi:acetyltransferase [Liquorilactobacillus ghanensis DSM 18630]|uniref:Acetyltransferase n=1 Tax=Liquorilactobacillus ghanensis DSM 18630 TaxID=1423750 RepID=A0A0R1VQT9_9LACO|nr:GNAT family N-acetyltransferase [Liquorilactobacillus ghanensis]KRM08145.1 acetyltransferase [Liquorilactobacillus ghanensis DSM 18630]